MNNLIVFATYWNERTWIQHSLRQIEAIDPIEVIVCDGCFDNQRENRSTDGTREIIESWCAQRENRTMVGAVRVERREAMWQMLRGLDRSGSLRFRLPRLYRALKQGSLKHLYRINQALTFAHMIRLSRHWAIGGWFMTYDADQYYCDDTLAAFDLCNDPDTTYGLICATERTFLSDARHCTTGYERRTWNNMPHRICADTVVYPTRLLYREGWFRARRYVKAVPTIHVGHYHHYKFVDAQRVAAGYSLGDRKPPSQRQIAGEIPFTGNHPAVVAELFG